MGLCPLSLGLALASSPPATEPRRGPPPLLYRTLALQGSRTPPVPPHPPGLALPALTWDLAGLSPSCRGEPAGDAEPGEAEPLTLSENQEKGRKGDPEGRPGPSSASLGTEPRQGAGAAPVQPPCPGVPHLLPMERRLLPFSFRLLLEDARRRVTLREGTGLAGSGVPPWRCPHGCAPPAPPPSTETPLHHLQRIPPPRILPSLEASLQLFLHLSITPLHAPIPPRIPPSLPASPLHPPVHPFIPPRSLPASPASGQVSPQIQELPPRFLVEPHGGAGWLGGAHVPAVVCRRRRMGVSPAAPHVGAGVPACPQPGGDRGPHLRCAAGAGRRGGQSRASCRSCGRTWARGCPPAPPGTRRW